MEATFKKFEVGETVFRNGDLLFKKTDIPVDETLKTQTRLTLHKGYNHDHDLHGRFYVREEGARRFVGLVGPSKMLHAEHGTIAVTPEEIEGTELELDIQREYDHFLEESRQVID